MEYMCGNQWPNGERSRQKGERLSCYQIETDGPKWRGCRIPSTQHGPSNLIRSTHTWVRTHLKSESIIQFSPSNDQWIRLPEVICLLSPTLGRMDFPPLCILRGSYSDTDTQWASSNQCICRLGWERYPRQWDLNKNNLHVSDSVLEKNQTTAEWQNCNMQQNIQLSSLPNPVFSKETEGCLCLKQSWTCVRWYLLFIVSLSK